MLRGLGKGNQVLNRLKAVAKTSGKLSQLEQSFLRIVELKETDAPIAREQLVAFIALHDHEAELDESVAETVEAAKAFEPAFATAAAETVKVTRTKIVNALKRAQSAESFDEAVKLYESIIKLYADVPWVEDLTARAADELEQLKKE